MTGIDVQSLVCPYCGVQLTLEDNFGDNLVPDGKVITDLLGQEIRNHYIGNCYECWGSVEVINGKIGMSLLIPVSTATPDSNPTN